ncbi:MAG: fructose-bisphosphate aldolase class I [Rhodospirillaceae bacterium]|jgi:fructose-bisphosphate aldolase, class I|nr:fructose-bisphosphate aldolase class I [Rhodospirillaceae bacterium]MBT3494245.1 fructose-bisphosphate aldolase class I [Rhodospirillaceae bacterium]MBT3778675.1 fructose-bisphosphate aldolase class I [Rhodospirillaceae bacterium]MBT3979214.1 fructose-bisphosphate aldolase class I [Rhodospirillaceae bacterium]MBT4170745.1 fructose-bisphosphate aldolase class I [Rhodospirillaceae bacterium]
MTNLDIIANAARMVAPGKGILAADESTGTIEKRLHSIDVVSTEDSRRDYRGLLFTTPGVGDHISGVILYDETLRQAGADGVPFSKVLWDNGILPGIKVDAGAKELAGCPGEKVTEGLDGLRERLAEYVELGAAFTKWRAVIDISADIPSRACLQANAHALARYAALSQEAGLVPIVEPEVLMDGGHDIERCREVTELALELTFRELFNQNVVLEGMVLKPNMVLAGKKCARQNSVDDVAAMTVKVLRRQVPAAVPGIAFLSGGQSEVEATAHLNAMNKNAADLPWQLSFSYGRALQASALQAWRGEAGNVPAAQAALAHRAKMNGLARRGGYRVEMEKDAA